VPVSLRKRKRPRAHAAFVNVKYPAVWVQHFTVSGGAEYRSLRKGIADMLITELGSPLESACGGVIVEREKLEFLLTEQLITNPGQPPSTDRFIAHNREVGGSWSVAGGTATLTVNVTDVVSGATRSVTRTGDANRSFELVPSVIQEVVRLLCGKPPRYYAGPGSGSTTAAAGSSSETVSWTGNVRLKFTGDLVSEPGGAPPGEYARYQPESGSLHVTIDGVNAECTYHGAADVTIVPPPLGGQDSFIQQGVPAPAIVAAADFSRFRTVVDVGGGDGTLLAAILDAEPEVEAVAFDVPEALGRAFGRLRTEAGDFFESVPAGADAYVLKQILHDWQDEPASAILRRCRAAMDPGARLLILERMLPERATPADLAPLLVDILMLVATAGRERTEREFRELLAATDLQLLSVSEALPPFGYRVIEAAVA
jgi:hypothetical protein